MLLPCVSFADTSVIDAITTPHIVLYEANSGTVLYERAADERAYPASTTKIMTCIVALEQFEDLDATYTCGYEAVNGFGPQSSLLHLQPGYVVTIRDMLYGLMLVSGNDCGACLAYASAGSMDAFVGLMNQKAEEIGMENTHYANAHGLHNDLHYTTAYDMALLMSYALKNEDFRQIAAATEYTVTEANGKFTSTIYTSNRLLYTKPNNDNYEYPYAIGGKTGETNVAGYTLVEAAEKDGVTLVAVLMGDDNQGGTSSVYRFQNAVKLFDWGFDNYACYDYDDFDTTGSGTYGKIALDTGFFVQTSDYDPADEHNGLISANADISDIRLCGLKDDLGTVEASAFAWSDPVIDADAVKAPVAVGDKIGTASLYYNGTLLMDCDVLASSAVAAKGDEQVDASEGDKPYATTFINTKSATNKDKVCNLTVSKNGGEDKYTVWIFYDNTLCTMDTDTTCYYLYYDGEVFRTSTATQDNSIKLYRIIEGEDGGFYYTPDAEAESGGMYIVSSNGMALKAQKSGRSLAAVPLEFDGQGNLITSVGADMIWTFTQKGNAANGFQLKANGRYLHRSPGDGLLFWILIGVLVIALAVVLRLLFNRKSRLRRSRRRSSYRIYRG